MTIRHRYLSIAVATLLFALVFGCETENHTYMHYRSVPGYEWSYENQIPFTVTIEDTQALYNMYVVVRHNDQYPFRNLWTILHTQTPSEKKKQEKIELQLQRKDGQWYGAGLGGIMEVSIPIAEKKKFHESGTYQFKLEQHMRKNPLPGVMNVGLRIEKLPPGTSES